MIYSRSTRSIRQQNYALKEQFENNLGRIRAIFLNAPAEIYLKDVDGRYIMINPQFEKLFNVKNNDVVGLLPTDIHDPELGAKTRAHDLMVLAERKTVVRDELALTHLGLRTLHTIKFPTYDRSGALTGLGAIVTDVTDLRRSEQEMRQAQKMDAVGQLTGGVAHDFNNLLAVILGNLELLDELEDGPERNECIQIALQAVESGADLTKNLLSFAKKAPLAPEVFDLNRLVHETRRWCSRVIPPNIDIGLVLDGSIGTVLADRSMTQSALLNIMLNSHDAMPDGGKIKIETFNLSSYPLAAPKELPHSDLSTYECVRISDIGVGIPAAELANVFAPFHTTKTDGSGSGLGLSMVQGFMTQSQGAVSVSSEVGVGTVVTLFFRSMEMTTDADSGPDIAAKSVSGKKARILLAEDNNDLRRSITRILELAGHKVSAFSNGKAALTEFTKNPKGFDLLITDILMPGEMQGPMLVDEAKKLSSEIHVILLSGYPRADLIDGGDYLSNNVYLMKPIAAEKLRTAVMGLLD